MNYSETDILDYIEGRLGNTEAAALENHQRNNPEFASMVEAMRASNIPIAEAYNRQPLPPVPESVKQTLQQAAANIKVPAATANADLAKPAKATWFSKVSGKNWLVAACLAAGVGIGGLLSLQLANTPSVITNASHQDMPESHAAWVQRVADYQSLYVEQTVSALSANNEQNAMALLQKIKSSAGIAVAIPDFSALGYEFARAQQLGFEGQTLVQLVYRKPGTTPMALCFMRADKQPELAMLTSTHHHLLAASWIQQEQQFVLVADESVADIKKLHLIAESTFKL